MTGRLVESVPAHLRTGLPAPTATTAVAPAAPVVLPARTRVRVPRPGRVLTDTEAAQLTAARRVDLVQRAETLAALAAALDEL